MTKTETVGAVKERKLYFYSIWNLFTKPQNNLGEIRKGRNTFICDKEKDRLDLYKSKS